MKIIFLFEYVVAGPSAPSAAAFPSHFNSHIHYIEQLPWSSTRQALDWLKNHPTERIQCIGRKSLWSSSEFYLQTPFMLSIHRQEQFVSLVCLSLNLLVFTNRTSVIMFIWHMEMCKLSKGSKWICFIKVYFIQCR